MSKDFDLGDILSVTTGLLVSPRLMDGVYDILNYMTEDSLFTHQLPRAAGECKEPLLTQHPQLRGVEAPDEFTDGDHVFAWLDSQKAIYGDSLPVAPLGTGGVGSHERRDPLAELAGLLGSERVIAVVADDAESA